MPSTPTDRVPRFRSIAELTKHAAVTVDRNISCKMYMNAALNIFNQADSYALEKDRENAYLLYMKGCRLVLELLPKHPSFSSVPSAMLSKSRDQAVKAMERMEKLKPQLVNIYKQLVQLEQQRAQRASVPASSVPSSNGAPAPSAEELERAEQQREMAALEARLLALGAKPDELPSYGTAPSAPIDTTSTTDNAVEPPPPTTAEPMAPPSTSLLLSASTLGSAALMGDAVYPSLRPAPLGDAFVPSAVQPPAYPPAPSWQTTPSAPQPTAPTAPPPTTMQQQPSAPPPSTHAAAPMQHPQTAVMLSSDQASVFNSTAMNGMSAPAMPSGGTMPSAPPITSTNTVPGSIVYAQRPNDANTFKSTTTTTTKSPTSAPAPKKPAEASPYVASGASLGGGSYQGLRNVAIDQTLAVHFLKLAYPNTSRGIETCGVLTGKLKNGEFVVTHLIIPRQKGTTDTCETVDEDQLFEYQCKNDLITLGWIHTHPTQDCFLSSVDLHTQASYQLMLPEAIAIVMAPSRKPDNGIFALSSTGLEIVRACRLTGFHPHPERGIYGKAQHVYYRRGQPIYRIVDFR